MSAPQERKLQETGKNQVSPSKESQRIRKVRKTITDAIKKERDYIIERRETINFLEYLKNFNSYLNIYFLKL